MNSIISREAATERSDLLFHLRRGLHERGFVEVHTPILLKGGVNPHLHFSEGSYTLRDCMELRLRSALASGLPRVFEIGPCFRMGDSDALRNPEFYMMELFGTQLDYTELVGLACDLFAEAGCRMDSLGEVSVGSWIANFTGIDPDCPSSRLRDELIARGHVNRSFLRQPAFRAVNDLIECKLEPQLRGWTVLKDFPKCTLCLAKPQEQAAHLVERFEIYWNDMEVAHGFVDDCDAEGVEGRMIENGPEFHDRGFLRLLESDTFPKSGGFGFGIERLLMAKCGTPQIKEYLHLPQFGTSQLL